KGDLLDEADVSTQSAPPGEDAWVPRTHEDEGRTKGLEAPSGEGPQTVDRLSGGLSRHQRLTTSAEFQALFQRGKRIDRPALIVLWRESNDPTRVGFAGRGNWRLVVRRIGARGGPRGGSGAARDAAPARAGLVVSGSPAVLREPFPALLGQMRQALAAIPRQRRA